MSHNKVTLNQNYFFDIESKALTNLVGDVISLGENEKRVLSVFVSNENTVISKKQLIYPFNLKIQVSISENYP